MKGCLAVLNMGKALTRMKSVDEWTGVGKMGKHTRVKVRGQEAIKPNRRSLLLERDWMKIDEYV